MPIVVNLDVMMARRKMSLNELSEKVGLTLSNLSILKTGKAKALAVTTPKRSSALPQVPTMNSIYPGFEADNWYAMFFPKGTPRPIVDKMNAEIRKAIDTQEMRDFMPREALDPVASTPEELSALLKREIEKYAKVIERANIRVE